MLNKKTTALQLKTLAMVVGLVLTSSAYAERNENGHGYGHSPAVTHFSAAITGTAGQGHIQYTSSTAGGGIEAGITLPVTYPTTATPASTLADSNSAIAANVSLVFPNGGGAGVTCNLLVEDIYLKYPKSPSTAAITEAADYELSVKNTISGTTSTVTATAGSCVTTGTTTPAVPVVLSGDPVDVYLNGAAIATLVGTFK
jgi:hypothetical protein